MKKKNNKKREKISVGEALIILDGMIGLIADIISHLEDHAFQTSLCMHGYWDLLNTVKTYSNLDNFKQELKFFNGHVINKS